MATFFITSLGCPKNLVDSERLGGALCGCGLTPAPAEEAAQVIVVNTCGFIREACQESLETVLSLAGLKGRLGPEGRSRPGKGQGKRLLVVAGCLSGRYGEALKAELPEVDLFFGPLMDREAALEAARQIAAAAGEAGVGAACAHRLSPPHRAYVKIAEGCSNRCTYCTIPAIRGPRRSRPPEELLEEVAALGERGVREVTLVAQDTSAYGADLRPRTSLARLVERLAGDGGPDWLRLLYLHPARLGERLIEAMSAGGKILPYFDLPVQHASPAVLERMGRRGYSAASVLRLIGRVREASAEAVLRTSVMVGFPGEGEREFAELMAFVRQAAFDHLGCFIFSPEEGTPAARLRPRVSRRVAERRRAAVMELAAEISQARNEALIGRMLAVLVEEADGKGFRGRAARHAPEIDGQVVGQGQAAAGELVSVRITSADAYDLYGRLEAEASPRLAPGPD